MSYNVLYSKKALQQLKKMDNHNKLYILSWIDKNLEGTSDPYAKGKTLRESIRYRVGNYRIIAEVQKDKLIILFLNAKRRSSVYK